MMHIENALDYQATNHRLSPWLRVTMWAMANADGHGRARAYPGELREFLGTSSHEVSRAIRLAKDRRLLHESSHAGCLVLIGYTQEVAS
jgi:hypothetical protein